MKYIHFLSLMSLFLLCLLAKPSYGQNTSLTGNIKGLDGDTIEISYNQNGAYRSQLVIAKKNVFTWNGNLEEPVYIGITVGHKSGFYFIEPGHIILTGNKDSIASLRVTGSCSQHDADDFISTLKDLIQKQEFLYNGFEKLNVEEKAKIAEKKVELNKQKKIRANEYIAAHPKSFYSLYLLIEYNTEYKDMIAMYENLDKSIRLTPTGKRLADSLVTLKKSLIGNKMIDFTQNDVSGKTVDFKSYKGKYVLVDFWASWCGPCRAENPKVLKAYNTYKSKGFTVVGISLDTKAENWKKAIQDDNMPWTQLSDLKGWKNELAEYYGIQGIPANFLVDPSGTIIDRDLRGSKLEKKLKEILN